MLSKDQESQKKRKEKKKSGRPLEEVGRAFNIAESTIRLLVI